jgi:hypothetical protein
MVFQNRCCNTKESGGLEDAAQFQRFRELADTVIRRVPLEVV